MGPQQRKVLLFKELGEEQVIGKGEDSKLRAAPAGKRAVVKVPSLLFDIELEDGAVEESTNDEDLPDVLRQLKSLAQPWSPVELQLQKQVHKAVVEAAEEGIKLDAHQLAKRLDAPGYTFKVRTALGGGGWSGDCLRQLRHYFLTCAVSGSLGPVSYIIDPCFRDQFEIANPTPQYLSILAEVPREFVGTEERISSLVTILGNEIKRSFQARGNALPPWRHPASMLSKWRPRCSEDTPVALLKSPQAKPLWGRTGLDNKPGKELLNPKVDISASSAASDDVARTIAETGGSRKLGVPAARPYPASPPIDCQAGNGSKRARDQSIGPNKCSSLLAAKLRGVSTCGPGSSFPRICSNKGQA